MNIIATIRPWHIELYRRELPKWDGDWRLVTNPDDLEALALQTKPRYIFFPHWSWRVPEWIWQDIECVCFHETPLPMGRGGSPIQNAIAFGYDETLITAFRVTGDIDAGPIYCQVPLSLWGLAEEIYIRSAQLIRVMIGRIARTEPEPVPQPPTRGFSTRKPWKRRTPEQSIIPETGTLDTIFRRLRMLDAAEYPHAFLEYGCFRFEFTRPALRVGRIEADVRITKI